MLATEFAPGLATGERTGFRGTGGRLGREQERRENATGHSHHWSNLPSHPWPRALAPTERRHHVITSLPPFPWESKRQLRWRRGTTSGVWCPRAPVTGFHR